VLSRPMRDRKAGRATPASPARRTLATVPPQRVFCCRQIYWPSCSTIYSICALSWSDQGDRGSSPETIGAGAGDCASPHGPVVSSGRQLREAARTGSASTHASQGVADHRRRSVQRPRVHLSQQKFVNRKNAQLRFTLWRLLLFCTESSCLPLRVGVLGERQRFLASC
jgi:hypothetical protein